MKEALKKYKKQCKVKTITFYKHEADLLKFANSINFQKFVKECLKCEIIDRKGEYAIPLDEEDYIGVK